MSTPPENRVAELLGALERAKPAFIAQPGMDQAVAAVLRLAMEVSALRDRLDTHEALAEASGAYGAAEIEAYQPDPERRARRAAERARLIDGLMRDLRG
jgi:hypothetical protein